MLRKYRPPNLRFKRFKFRFDVTGRCDMAPAGGGFAVPACSCLLNRSDPRRNQGHPCSRIRGRPWAMQLLRISLQTIGYRLNHEQIIGYCLIRKKSMVETSRIRNRPWAMQPLRIQPGRCAPCFGNIDRLIFDLSDLIFALMLPVDVIWLRLAAVSLCLPAAAF